MSTHSQQLRSKSSLSITLTEPFVILRTADAAASPLLGEFAPSSVLRGLLALDLSKASKISSIQIELLATSCAAWSEGMSYVHSSFDP
jgi:arrestin-related trafficking adapter 3/6